MNGRNKKIPNEADFQGGVASRRVDKRQGSADEGATDRGRTEHRLPLIGDPAALTQQRVGTQSSLLGA